ncbi:glycerophosphodiester phosphodiesterase [Bacillus sp. BRMEA1]|nr:glycerophosphodiester phosphodiesterase [Neobacillus endophyticus]
MKKYVTILMIIFVAAYRLLKKQIKAQSHFKPLKIGHRGAAGYCPENTFASFHKALELGADYLEIDIQMTKDEELVVIHDATVNRTSNGKGKVKDFTLSEIQTLDAGSWFKPEFAGEKIPSFNEFLDEFAGKAGLLIELKKPSLYPGIEAKLANELIKRGLVGANKHPIIVQSFDRTSLKHFHNLLPSVPIGVLVKNRAVNGIPNKDLQFFSEFATYINPKIAIVNKRLINRIHQHGFKVFIWTVKKKSEANMLQRIGVDGIVSDYPDFF